MKTDQTFGQKNILMVHNDTIHRQNPLHGVQVLYTRTTDRLVKTHIGDRLKDIITVEITQAIGARAMKFRATAADW